MVNKVNTVRKIQLERHAVKIIYFIISDGTPATLTIGPIPHDSDGCIRETLCTLLILITVSKGCVRNQEISSIVTSKKSSLTLVF